MAFIKGIILCTVFCLSTYVGIMISNRYRRRTAQLYDMKKALNFFSAKLEYTYERLPDIFLEISNNCNIEIGSIFKSAGIKMKDMSANEAWDEATEISQTDLNKQDLEIVKEFGKTLGQTDLHGQINRNNLILEFLDGQISESVIEENRNKKMYSSLGVLTGLALVIIFV